MLPSPMVTKKEVVCVKQWYQMAHQKETNLAATKVVKHVQAIVAIIHAKVAMAKVKVATEIKKPVVLNDSNSLNA